MDETPININSCPATALLYTGLGPPASNLLNGTNLLVPSILQTCMMTLKCACSKRQHSEARLVLLYDPCMCLVLPWFDMSHTPGNLFLSFSPLGVIGFSPKEGL